MAKTTKTCKKCLKNKPLTEFSKMKASTDGLQSRCKECNKVDNKKFRTEINPHHHRDWQHKNMDRAAELVSKYRAADKGNWIYYIVSPEGKFYCGMTQMYPQVRFLEHRMKYRMYQKGAKPPCKTLYESFDKWGVENHKLGILLELQDIDRKELRGYEKECIKTFMKLGISLNKQI